MSHLPVASARRFPTRRGQPTTADILKSSNQQQRHAVTLAADRGSVSAPLRTPTFQFHRKVSTLSAIAVFVLLAANVLVVRASLTMSGTAVTGEGTLNLTGVGTSTIDVGSGALQLQTTNGGPMTTGGGLFTVGGPLIANGTSTFNGNVLVKNQNAIRYADQFAGADAGAKIVAAIANLGGVNGIVDARGFSGAQTLSSPLSVGAAGFEIQRLGVAIGAAHTNRQSSISVASVGGPSIFACSVALPNSLTGFQTGWGNPFPLLLF